MLFYLTFVLSYFGFSLYTFNIDVIRETNIELRNENVDKYNMALSTVFKNVCIYSIPAFVLINLFYIPPEFNLLWCGICLILNIYLPNPLFYFSHRYFHSNKTLYEYHRVHHEFKIPIGMASAYTHPIDFIFGNMVPLGLPLILLQCDVYTILILLVLGNYSTIVEEHSNYSSHNHHLLHHIYSNCNYGDTMIDTIMGTLRTKKNIIIIKNENID